MSENNPWTEQWFKAQQQFVDAWSDMARSGNASGVSQADLWAKNFDTWRKALDGRNQPDVELALRKCMDMGREYFAMAEQVGKLMSQGGNPMDAINQWLEQMQRTLQQFSGMPGFNGAGVNDFMKQWFSPSASWQDMVSQLTPMNQAMWQMPGMNTSVFNLGEAIDPLGKVLEAPGIGYFREPQEKQQRGIQLALEYQEANYEFNQAFLRVALESIQGFQQRLLKLDVETLPQSLRQLYDLWVEVSEAHYAEFAMSDEYQALYGDMVNKLMAMRKHYGEIADDFLRAVNLPNTREIDTMQERLQQLRRDNFALKRELGEIKATLARLVDKSEAKPAAARPKAAKPAAARPKTAKPAAPAPAPAEPAAAKSATTGAATAEPAEAKATTAARPARAGAAKKKAPAKKSAVKKAKTTRAKAGA